MLTEKRTHLQLKVALDSTELPDFLRRVSNSSQNIDNEKKEFSCRNNVVAEFSTALDTLTLSGIFHNHHSIQFELDQQTKSYENVLRFLIKELRSINNQQSLENTHSSVSFFTQNDSDRSNISITELIKHLESKLEKITSGLDSESSDGERIIEVFRNDFVPIVKRRPMVVRKQAARFLTSDLNPQQYNYLPNRPRFVLKHPQTSEQTTLRLMEQGQSVPTLISGFLSLEIEEVAETASNPDDLANASVIVKDPSKYELLRNSLSLIEVPSVEVSSQSAEIRLKLKVDPTLIPDLEFYLHWGSYDLQTSYWCDEEVSNPEFSVDVEGLIFITKRISPKLPGSYGATFFTRFKNENERVWLGRYLQDDLTFNVSEYLAEEPAESRQEEIATKIRTDALLLGSLSNFNRFVKVVSSLAKDESVRGLGKILFDATKHDSDLRKLLADYYQQVVLEISTRRPGVQQTRLRTVLSVLQNIGIGEVVFVAPEGHHAIGGGLAQVIVGLTGTLSRIGISTTVISPLYEESQGNKHKSAEEVIQNGLDINGQIAELKEVGWVRIPFGPTYVSGTSEAKTNPLNALVQVYLAQAGSIRVFLLRHRKLADRLYPHIPSDEQLRRAIFLSRGALEVIRDSSFGVSPHIIVTNDWLSALIPAYLRTDPLYCKHSRFSGVESVHVLHNCGRDYQGRFYANRYGEDLWPLLGLDSKHYFGLADPGDRSYLNLTAGAIFHSGKGLLAVSKPYAQQLLTREGGEGLSDLFSLRERAMFGISNGVDLSALRRIFWKLGENAREALKLEPLIPKRFTDKRLIKQLPFYKQATKIHVQRKYGLNSDSDALLISLIGRLAEQKGIQLLAGNAKDDTVSVIEKVLLKYPDVQFLIGGPPAHGDPAMELLATVVEDLTRRYPGRIQSIYSFIPHKDALEITQASDFFLMPSRYEPGGITQLEALACGTVVIARKVGGIAATLIDCALEMERGNSFLFSEFSTTALREVIFKAIEVFKDEERRNWLIGQAALAENDWGHRAPKYITVLQHIVGVLDPRNLYPHLTGRSHLLNSVRPS